MITFYSKSLHQYAALSNFAQTPVLVDGVTWPSVEHFYQAMKDVSPAYRTKVRAAQTPAEARKLGKCARLRAGWNDARINVMKRGLWAKFTQNPQMARLLLETGEEELIHYAPWDTFWGVDDKGAGQNQLGQLLMLLRAKLRTMQ